MFEKDEDYRKARKESKDKITKVISVWCAREETIHDVGFQQGAEFGYNKAKEDADKMKSRFLELCHLKDMRIEKLEKANEWHYVKDEGTPKVEGHYLVCLRNKDRDIFDCWIYYDKDVGWYSMKVRIKDIYAWKEIVLPKLKESE